MKSVIKILALAIFLMATVCTISEGQNLEPSIGKDWTNLGQELGPSLSSTAMLETKKRYTMVCVRGGPRKKPKWKKKWDKVDKKITKKCKGHEAKMRKSDEKCNCTNNNDNSKHPDSCAPYYCSVEYCRGKALSKYECRNCRESTLRKYACKCHKRGPKPKDKCEWYYDM